MTKPISSFRDAAESYADEKLFTIANNKADYPYLLVEAVTKEIQRRELKIPDETAIPPEKYFLYLSKIRAMINSGSSLEECRAYLKELGLIEVQIENMVKKATQKTTEHIISPYQKKDHYGMSLGAGMFAIFVLIQILKYLLDS